MPTPGIVTTNGICAAPPPPETGHKITGGGRLFPNVSFGFVAKDTPLNGALQYQDPDFMGGIKVHSQNGIASVTFAPPCATFDGSAKLNQQPGYSFRVTACDMANPGAGKDTFTIHVFGPNGFFYSKEGTLTEGNIVLH